MNQLNDNIYDLLMRETTIGGAAVMSIAEIKARFPGVSDQEIHASIHFLTNTYKIKETGMGLEDVHRYFHVI